MRRIMAEVRDEDVDADEAKQDGVLYSTHRLPDLLWKYLPHMQEQKIQIKKIEELIFLDASNYVKNKLMWATRNPHQLHEHD